jgi:hypothetical protein
MRDWMVLQLFGIAQLFFGLCIFFPAMLWESMLGNRRMRHVEPAQHCPKGTEEGKVYDPYRELSRLKEVLAFIREELRGYTLYAPAHVPNVRGIIDTINRVIPEYPERDQVTPGLRKSTDQSKKAAG